MGWALRPRSHPSGSLLTPPSGGRCVPKGRRGAGTRHREETRSTPSSPTGWPRTLPGLHVQGQRRSTSRARG
eukprot:4208856-Alexandrium_andersonii.AAC.1